MEQKFYRLLDLVDLVAARSVKDFDLPEGHQTHYLFADGPDSIDTSKAVKSVARQEAVLLITQMIERREITARTATQIPAEPPIGYVDFRRYMVRKEDADRVIAHIFGTPPATAQAKDTTPVPAPVGTASVALPKQRAQESRILELLTAQSYDPLKLSKRSPGKPGPKAEIRTLALTEPALFTTSSFDKAWERLRNDGAVAGAE